MKLSTIDTYRDCQKVLTAACELGRTTILTLAVVAAGAATGACSSSTAGAGTPTDPGTGTGSGTGTGTGSGSGTGTGTGSGTGSGPEGGAPRPAAAFFRGKLAGTVAASKAASDPFFSGVKAEAMEAGDNGHDALLGTTVLGTTLDQFVGLDTWSSDANMDAVYSNPQVQAFAKAFYAAPPEFKTFYVSDFYQWGNTDSGDAYTPHYFVVIRGRFNDTPDKIKALHDPIAQGAEAQLKGAGDVAHLVWYGRQDPQDALIVDIWSADTNIDSVYSSASLKTSVASLFDAIGPNYGVYGSTDWVTW
jgi:hypothetical protein